MKIFLMGAQGTGKSTLNYELHKHLPQLEVLDSLSGLFMYNKEDQVLGSDNNESFQRKFYLYALNKYVNDKNFISSRSFIDPLAYMDKSKRDNTLRDMAQLYEKDMIEGSDIYYFYLPIEFNISQDNNELRIVDKENQNYVGKFIEEQYIFYKKQYPDTFFLITGSLKERVKQILNIIKYESNTRISQSSFE